MKFISRKFLLRYLKFGSIGTWGAVVNVTLLFVLTEFVGIDYRIASIAAIECQILNNFILNYTLTWKNLHGGPWRKKIRMFIKFNLTSLSLAFFTNWTLLVVLTEFGGMNHNIANLISILLGNISSIMNFLISHFWIFRKKKKPIKPSS